MREFNGTAGNVKLVTPKQFFQMIVRKKLEKDPHQFNTLVSNGSFGLSTLEENLDDCATYQRRQAYLAEGDEEEVLKTALFYQASSRHMFNDKPAQLLEDMTVHHAMNFGATDVIVRLGNRMFLPANLDDFAILELGNKRGLACYAAVRTTIFEVLRATEQQCVDLANQLSSPMAAQD